MKKSIKNYKKIFILKRIIHIVLIIMFISIVSCSSSKSLSPKAALELMNKNSDYVLLDLRKSFKFRDGHIRGAISVEFHPKYFKNQILKIEKDKTVIIYCETGMKTSEAKSIMENMGFVKLYIIEGGLRAWQEAGLEIIK